MFAGTNCQFNFSADKMEVNTWKKEGVENVDTQLETIQRGCIDMNAFEFVIALPLTSVLSPEGRGGTFPDVTIFTSFALIRKESYPGGLDNRRPFVRGYDAALHEDALALRLNRGKRIRDPAGYVDAPRFIFQYPVAPRDHGRRRAFSFPAAKYASHRNVFTNKTFLMIENLFYRRQLSSFCDTCRGGTRPPCMP